MNSEKVKEIKKVIQETIDGKLSTAYLTVCEISCCPRLDIDKLFADILTLINELESENETLKLNIQETEKASYNINQMNGNLIIENQTLKDRIAELEKDKEKWQIKAVNYYQMAKSYGIECIIDNDIDETLKEYEK